MLSRIDGWIGRRLFVPLIVRVCQAAKITQYRFSNYAFALSLLAAVARGPEIIGWVGFVAISLIAVLRICIAALAADWHTGGQGSRFWRMFGLASLALNLAASPLDLDRSVFWLAMLFGEYALTIHTIPPRETKEPRRKLARAAR